MSVESSVSQTGIPHDLGNADVIDATLPERRRSGFNNPFARVAFMIFWPSHDY
jgi:hypothetical protein